MKAKKTKPKVEPALVHYLVGVGGTAMGADSINGVGIYSLEAMINRGKINGAVDPSDISPYYPKTIVYFANTKSVDREIRRLSRMKKIMLKQRAELKKVGIRPPLAEEWKK